MNELWWSWWWGPWGLSLLGLCAGSFINVVVHRWPRQLERQWWRDVHWALSDTAAAQRVLGLQGPGLEPLNRAAEAVDRGLHATPELGLVRPGSRCPACGHALRWWENIPVLSFLVLRARCSACSAPIAWRYPLVELATAGLFLAVGVHTGFQPLSLLWCAVVGVLLALALIDWDTTYLPDGLTQPLLWGGLVAAAAGFTVPLREAVTGAVAGYLVLAVTCALFKRVTGKDGMGEGDFKLLAALGAWFGAAAVWPILWMACLGGIAVGLVMKWRGRLREGRYVPFGPFLVLGAALMQTPLARWLSWP